MPLIDAAERFLRDVASDASLQPLRATAVAAADRLGEPLRVAVCGQLSAGKSTLVNALVGRRLAATGVGETTEVNWWFRHGSPERAVLRRRGGGEVTVPLDNPLPVLDDLDTEAVDAITIHVEHELLEDLVVIDTPGLFSPTGTTSERTRELIGARTERASASADALLYLTHEVPGASRDVRTLAAFGALFGTVRKAPTNSLLLLSKCDEWWDATGADERPPLAIGAQLLGAHRDELWRHVWASVPAIGLLAEAATVPGALDDAMVADLRTIAAHPKRRRAYRRARVPASLDVGVPPERVQALLDALGPYGLARALEHADAPGASADAVRAALLEDSGLPVVGELLRRTFRERSALIRTDAALAALERSALARPDGLAEADVSRVRAGVEELRVSPGADGLRRLRALRIAMDERLRLAADARRELRLLLADGSPHERLGMEPDVPLDRLAADLPGRWRRWRALENAVPASPERRVVAAAACEACEQLTREVERMRSGRVRWAS
ncbi:MAG: hypothetical protein QOG63_1435 [Thermoleophilaceae bacterium]|nr:hypothetical protein [Thermoleophilaceae bacterium]